MKRKENERDKRKQREMYRGELNRRDLRFIILSSGDYGVTVGQIVTQFSKQFKKVISRQQVHKYLKEAGSKSLFYKEGSRYYMKHVVTHDDWSVFSEYISGLQYFSNFKKLRQDRESQSKFQKNSLENILFQFSNQIGALLSYIMIEAVRPTETLKLMGVRKKIALRFVKDAISPENLLGSFLAALPYDFRMKHKIGLVVLEGQNGISVIKPSIAPLIDQFYIKEGRNPLQEIINAFSRVYPNLYDSLEKGYIEYVNMKPEATCDHEWETINIHKIGEGYKCHKCLHTIEQEAFKRLFLN